jgi:hypothetical protein
MMLKFVPAHPVPKDHSGAETSFLNASTRVCMNKT